MNDKGKENIMGDLVNILKTPTQKNPDTDNDGLLQSVKTHFWDFIKTNPVEYDGRNTKNPLYLSLRGLGGVDTKEEGIITSLAKAKTRA
jgi:hypothetical protein